MPRPRFIVIVLVLLALNYVSVALFAPGKERSIDDPVQPDVPARRSRPATSSASPRRARRSSGEFKKAVKPPDDPKGKAAKNFETEIPTFANTDELSKLLAGAQRRSSRPSRSTRAAAAHQPDPRLRPGDPAGRPVRVPRPPRRRRRADGRARARSARSRARRVEGGEQRVTFTDVAGIDEAKAELTEIVDFLKNPEQLPEARRPDPARRAALRPARHRQDAARPRGRGRGGRAVLLDLARRSSSRRSSASAPRACATCSSRPRRPRRRSSSSTSSTRSGARARRASAFGGGNDEREQTLNQILTEMDGFESDDAVIVLGATNRAGDPRPARCCGPGRFDRRVAVPPPDKDGPAQDPRGPHALAAAGRRRRPRRHRRDHARHGRRRPRQPRQRGGADWPRAATTSKVQLADFTDALEKIVLGAPRGTVLSEEDRSAASPTTRPATRSSACSRRAPTRCARSRSSRAAMALGVTLSAPDLDKRQLRGGVPARRRIKVALGGRVAEEIVYGTITTGAESDIQQLTGIARAMVGRWGMSRAIGPIAVLPARGAAGRCCPGASEVSQDTQRLIDQRGPADRRGGPRSRSRALLTEHRDKLESLIAGAARGGDARRGRRLRGGAGRPARGPHASERADASPSSRSRRGRAGRRCRRRRAARGRRRAARRPRSGSRARSAAGRSRAAAWPSRCECRTRRGAASSRSSISSPWWWRIELRQRPVGAVVGAGDVEDLVACRGRHSAASRSASARS